MTGTQTNDLLSPLEMEILTLIGHCLTRKQIAHRLRMGSVAIRGHEERIYEKIGVTRRTQAAIYAWRTGVVNLDDAWNTVMSQEWGIE